MNLISEQSELSYNLGLLQEECAELIQIISKIKRFGLYEQQPGNPFNNFERMKTEINDVLAVIHLLSSEGLEIVDYEQQSSKLSKIELYKGYSRQLGLLEEQI